MLSFNKINRYQRKNDANKVFLFTNARDEPNMAEWICHHLLLGFDKIIIFDHLSKVPLQRLGNFGNKVNYIPVKGENLKLFLIRTAVNISLRNNVSWMMYLDADEFLCLNTVNNIKELLQIYHFADLLAINWLLFGSSYHVKQPKGLLMDNFTKSEKNTNIHIKSFVRPQSVRSITNPHFYHVYNKKRSIAVSGNFCVGTPFNGRTMDFSNVQAFIAHYITQSEEEFRRRKGRKMDDGSINKVNMYPKIHDVHNEENNLVLKNKYSERVKEMLTKFNISL